MKRMNMKQLTLIMLIGMNISHAKAYSNDSLSMLAGVSGVSLMAASLSQGKLNKTTMTTLWLGGLAVTVGNSMASDRSTYQLATSVGCLAACYLAILYSAAK